MSSETALPTAGMSAKRTRGGRDRLLQAATDLFNAHSLAGTSLQMIANALGIRKASIYSHFTSKEELVNSLLVPVLDAAEAAVRRLDDVPERERRSAGARFLAEFYVEHRRVVGLVLLDRGGLDSALDARVESLVAALGDVLAGSADPVAAARGEGTVYGMAAVVQRRPTLSDEELRGLITDILVVGR